MLSRKLIFTILLSAILLVSGVAYSQQDTLLSNNLREEKHESTIHNHAPLLYNGFEYLDYPVNYFEKGHQFYGDGEWNVGTVVYDGITYQNVSVLYDLVKDELIIKHIDGVSKLNLIKSKVQEFKIIDQTFINIQADSSQSIPHPYFYNQLYKNNLAVLVRRYKQIQESTSLEGVIRNLYTYNKYYLLKDGTYHPFNKKSSLLKIMKDKKPQIEQYLKTNNIDYGKDPERAMVLIAAFYDTIQKD